MAKITDLQIRAKCTVAFPAIYFHTISVRRCSRGIGFSHGL
jgi:hypothetical protein